MKYTLTYIILGFYLLITTSCTGPSPTENVANAPSISTPGPAKGSLGTGAYFAINEVGLGANGFVALTNFTDQPANLAGLYLCQGFNCFELPDVTVAAGETVRIAVGDGAGLEDVVASHATLGDLRPSDGEIAMLNSQNPKDPKAMFAYLQWGSTPHDLTQIAIDNGLWVQGGYGPSSDIATRLFRVPETGLWLFDEP